MFYKALRINRGQIYVAIEKTELCLRAVNMGGQQEESAGKCWNEDFKRDKFGWVDEK